MQGPCHILVIEDEPLIAMMLEDFLDTLGREVVASADTVATALARIGQGGMDGAILDVHLRGGEHSGPVAAALAAAAIPFVIATGGNDALDDTPEYRDRPVLSKPFTMAAVEKALAALG